MTVELQQVVPFVAVALGIYGGIRADLARLHVKVESAHSRIDQLTKGESHGEETSQPHTSA